MARFLFGLATGLFVAALIDDIGIRRVVLGIIVGAMLVGMVFQAFERFLEGAK